MYKYEQYKTNIKKAFNTFSPEVAYESNLEELKEEWRQGRLTRSEYKTLKLYNKGIYFNLPA